MEEVERLEKNKTKKRVTFGESEHDEESDRDDSDVNHKPIMNIRKNPSIYKINLEPSIQDITKRKVRLACDFFKGVKIPHDERIDLLTQPFPLQIGKWNLILIRKSNKISKMFTKYYLYDVHKKRFLLNAKKQFANVNSNYHITAMKDKFDKTDE